MRAHFYKILAVLTAAVSFVCTTEAKTRIIILVQEGLGHEMLTAARLYSEEQELWDWRLDHKWQISSLSTLPLTTKTHPDGSDLEALPAYDTLKSWDGTEVQLTPDSTTQTTFAGYKWLIENASDPMQSATALGSGVPSFNSSINWLSYPAKNGSPLPPTQQLIEWAHYQGLKTGVVSDMPFTHGTNTILAGARIEPDEPAISRFDYVLKSSPLDVYVAAGHPKYNELGQALSDPKYTFSSQNDWQDLRSRARENGWNLIFGDENLMGVNAQSNGRADKRLVILQFGDTTSVNAIASDGSGLSMNLTNSHRFQTKMALDQLNQSEKGFVAIIHMGRLPYFLEGELQKKSIEEVLNALHTMVTCEEWVDENGGWQDTSLLLLSSYEYGLVWGSNSSSYAFSQITNRGKKQIPGYRINHRGPTASLVPLLVRGELVEKIESSSQETDPIRGDYLALSQLGKILKGFVTNSESGVEQP